MPENRPSMFIKWRKMFWMLQNFSKLKSNSAVLVLFVYFRKGPPSTLYNGEQRLATVFVEVPPSKTMFIRKYLRTFVAKKTTKWCEVFSGDLTL